MYRNIILSLALGISRQNIYFIDLLIGKRNTTNRYATAMNINFAPGRSESLNMRSEIFG